MLLLHPPARLLIWASCVVLLQSVDGYSLEVLAATLLAVAMLVAPGRAFRMVRRARWLFLALGLVFAWATPGRLLWPDLAWMSPTGEGVGLAIDHGLRLLGTLMLVVLLLALTPRAGMLGGLYVLSAPVALLGMDRSRAAVRLALVLRYIDEGLPRGEWRVWLRGRGSADLSLSMSPVRISRPVFGMLDALACAVACGICAWAVFA
jgi:energy-coupling factor transporter transmembrane protein EcfT